MSGYGSAPGIRTVVSEWVDANGLSVDVGLPEFDDRLGTWRAVLLSRQNGRDPVGEVRVKAGSVVFHTDVALAAHRATNTPALPTRHKRSKTISFRPVPSSLVLGDARDVLADVPPGTAQLVFTSPPYYNAKPESHESGDYEDYLALMHDVFRLCHSVLSEGRFCVVNTSPVLMRRAHRHTSSRRIPIPFDLHAVMDRIGFEFVDDIIWQKPEGAGWHLGRGRRFAKDRQPLQYKPVTVTEYLMVYRKRTDRLIDWNIRYHPDPAAVKESLIEDGYERTNIWPISPAHHRHHPAVFPDALAERVIRYYSFAGDLVLDPFAGTGTTGRMAAELDRRFMLIEKSPDYYDILTSDASLAADNPSIHDYEYYAGTLL